MSPSALRSRVGSTVRRKGGRAGTDTPTTVRAAHQPSPLVPILTDPGAETPVSGTGSMNGADTNRRVNGLSWGSKPLALRRLILPKWAGAKPPIHPNCEDEEAS